MAFDPYDQVAPAVAYVEVEDPITGLKGIGSAFHVGDNVFVTAKHVVDKKNVLEVGTTQPRHIQDPKGEIEGRYGKRYRPVTVTAKPTRVVMSENADVAALVVPGAEELPLLWLTGVTDEPPNNASIMLERVTVLGYPRVPLCHGTVLLGVSAEVNGSFKKYTGDRHYTHFVISSMARGGFSGGPAILNGWILGLVTESLLDDPKRQPELGFMTVLHGRAIADLLTANNLMPTAHANHWAP